MGFNSGCNIGSRDILNLLLVGVNSNRVAGFKKFQTYAPGLIYGGAYFRNFTAWDLNGVAIIKPKLCRSRVHPF